MKALSANPLVPLPEALVRSSPAPTWLATASHICAANTAAVELFGAPDEATLLAKGDKLAASVWHRITEKGSAPQDLTLTGLDGDTVRVSVACWPGVADGIPLFQAVELYRLSADLASQGSCSLDPASTVQSEDLRRGVLDSTADCIKILSLDGQLLYMNPGGRQIMAVTDPDAVIGLNWLSFWTGEFRAHAEQALDRARSGSVGRFTGRCPRMNGEMRWWDVVVSPLRDGAGEVRRLLSISRDVTEIRENEQQHFAERQVLERIATDQTLVKTLDSINELLEQKLSGAAKSSILVATDHRRETFRVASAPGIPSLVGSVIRWDHFTGDTEAQVSRLTLAKAARWQDNAIYGPDHDLLGRLVVWIGDSGTELSRQSLEEASNLAAIALSRDTLLQRLRNKQKRLAAIDRAAPIGLYQIDAGNYWVFASERHGSMTGLRLEECAGEGWLRSVHPDDRGAIREIWLDATRNDRDFTAEYRLAGNEPGRGERWVVAHEASSGDGRVGTITDITEVKRALTAQAESAELFKTLANNISQFCWMADPTGWIFWYSERWYEYTGTTLEQMQGWGWRSVHHPDHVDRVVALISKCWETGEVWQDTFPLRGKNGEYRWFLSRALPIRDETGRVVRWFGTNTDVTELRELEHALQDQNLALRRSNEDLSRFAFFASHDLQEPLRAVSNFAQLAQRDVKSGKPETALGRLDTVVEAAKRMGRLIEDLLLYARASSANPRPAEPVPLGRVLDAVLLDMTPIIEATGATIAAEPLPEVCCTEAQLWQVLQNLLSNALKYRRPGVAPVIRITSEAHGNHWRVTLRDNGQGFKPEEAEQVFDFLRRLHGQDIPGTGLGLALCKTIIERNGGSIGAEGKVGEGAAFWFSLPGRHADGVNVPVRTGEAPHSP